MLFHEGYLGIGVAGIAVEGHHHLLTEFLHICHMLIEVFEAATQSVEVFLLDVGFGYAAMQFQTLCRGHYHCQFGL